MARERGLGTNEIQYTVRAHLGNVLQAGCLAWGFDLVNANVNDEYANKLDARSLPDVVGAAPPPSFTNLELVCMCIVSSSSG